MFFRAMTGGNSGPATHVDASPLVEAICVKLEATYLSPQRHNGKSISRWRLIQDKYHNIRNLVTLLDPDERNQHSIIQAEPDYSSDVVNNKFSIYII